MKGTSGKRLIINLVFTLSYFSNSCLSCCVPTSKSAAVCVARITATSSCGCRWGTLMTVRERYLAEAGRGGGSVAVLAEAVVVVTVEFEGVGERARGEGTRGGGCADFGLW